MPDLSRTVSPAAAARLLRAAALVGVLLVAAAAALAAPAAHAPRPAPAAQPAPLRIGIVLPAGDNALLGARLGVAEARHAARLFGTDLDVREVAAHGGGAVAAARSLASTVDAIIGGGDAAAADAMAAIAAASGVLFLNVGVPREQMQRPCSPGTFHLTASQAMRRGALATLTPDRRVGARVLGWHPELTRFGAGQVIDRFEREFELPMDERAWAGWLAVKILFDTSQRAGGAAPQDIAAFLLSPRAAFDGHKGVQLSFRPETRQLRQPVYVVAGGAVVAEVPDVRELGERTHAQLLDTIGEEEPCAG